MNDVENYYRNLPEAYYLFTIQMHTTMVTECHMFYSIWNDERTKTHDKLAAKYGLTREAMKKVTDHLDKTIGFNQAEDYAESVLISFAEKLGEKLEELRGNE